jgi:hypothetical protein
MMLDTGSQNSVLSEAAANRLGIVRDARFIGGGSAMTDTGLRQRCHRSTILGAARHPGTSGNVVPTKLVANGRGNAMAQQERFRGRVDDEWLARRRQQLSSDAIARRPSQLACVRATEFVTDVAAMGTSGTMQHRC